MTNTYFAILHWKTVCTLKIFHLRHHKWPPKLDYTKVQPKLHNERKSDQVIIIE